MYLQNHYQNAYVTHDIEKAIALLESRYGIQGLFPMDVEVDVVCPGPEKTLNMRLAFAWVGKTQIELIQPLSGCIQHYVDSLPTGKTDYRPCFNHIAMRRDDLGAMQREIESMKLPVLFEGGDPNGLRFTYVDARAELGHLLEYVWTTPDFWTLMGWPA